jgi:O-antigen ligase
VPRLKSISPLDRMKLLIPSLQYLTLTDNSGSFTKKEKILYVIFFCFLLTFYLPTKPVLNNIVLWLGVVLSFVSNTLSEKLKLLRERPAIILIIAFFGMHVVSSFFSVDTKEAISMLLLRSPLLFLPLSIGTLSISGSLRNHMLFLHAVITTVAALVCLINACQLSLSFHDTNYLYNDWLSDAIKMQSVYFSLMVTLAIFSYIHLTLLDPFIKKVKGFTWTAVVFLLAIQILLGSRIQLLFSYGSILLFIIYYFAARQRNLRAAVVVVSALGVFTFAYLSLFPKTANRFNEFRYPRFTYTSRGVQSHYNMPVTPDQWNGVNLRLAIWNCGWDAAKGELVWGISLGDKKSALQNAYRQKNFAFAYERRFNMHNTYLDVLLTFGLPGLLLFLLSFIILPLRSCFACRDILGAMIIGAFVFALLTETYPDRRMGCIMIGLFIPLVLSAHKTPAGSAKNPCVVP